MADEIKAALTEDEAELYDRQIRLWGIEAQWKLRNARILVIGMDGLGAEIVKNITLSGVKSVTMLDHLATTEEDFENQFLISRNSLNVNRAEASKLKVQSLNPLVSVEYDTQPVAEKSDDYFKNFDMIISCNQLPSVNLRIDEICRKNNVYFAAAGIFGTFGFAFYDLNIHTYTKEVTVVKKEGNTVKTTKETKAYPSLKEALEWDLKTPQMYKMCKKIPASAFILKVLLKFQKEHGRSPNECDEDLERLSKIRNVELEGVQLPESSFPEVVLSCLTTGLPNPICAIVGAIVAQEMVTAVSRKGEPQHNFFFFDPVKLVGHVQYLGPEIKVSVATDKEVKTNA